MQNKSRAELFKIVRTAAERMWVVDGRPVVCAALDELERRTSIDITERLERVCEDLAAFKRAHAAHRHERDGEADGHYGMTRPPRPPYAPLTGAIESTPLPPCDNPLFAVSSMRAEAEDRAWSSIEKWIESVRDHDVPHTRIGRMPDGGYSASLWHRGTQCAFKHGTSRLDALAHLATWCEEDMCPVVEVKHTELRKWLDAKEGRRVLYRGTEDNANFEVFDGDRRLHNGNMPAVMHAHGVVYTHTRAQVDEALEEWARQQNEEDTYTQHPDTGPGSRD